MCNRFYVTIVFKDYNIIKFYCSVGVYCLRLTARTAVTIARGLIAELKLS